MVAVGLIGASGFTGAELLRLVAGHPELELVCATGDSQAGTRAADLYPSLAGAYPDLVFEPFDADRVRGLDLEVRFEAGERIHTEYSHKYTRASVEDLLRRAGMEPGPWFSDARRWFGLSLARA